VHYLTFDLSDDTEGVATLDAMASTSAEQHPAVMAEVQQVLDWAWHAFPHTHGPADEGGQWDHDLQVNIEPDGWHSIALTLTADAAFAQEFTDAFGPRED